MDNGLPGDPRSVAQFQVPAMTRMVISQVADRTFGEFFPNMEGDFLRVESCDLPASVSFNNTDQSQAIPLLSGMTIKGKFSGITIWHDGYAAFTVARPLIVFNVGRINSMEVDNQNAKTLLTLPNRISGLGGGGFTVVFPIFQGYKKLSIRGSLTVSNATLPNSFLFLGFFQDATGNNISPSTIVKNGITYSAPNSRPSPTSASFVQIGPTAWLSTFGLEELPIPTRADRWAATIILAPAVTSVDDVGFSCHLS